MWKWLWAAGMVFLLFGIFYDARTFDLDDPRSFEVVNMDFGKQPEVLSASQQRTDIDFLLRGMDEVYAGKKVDPVLFAAFVQKMRGFQAEIRSDITADQFYYMLQFEVAMLEDGHLQFGYWKEQVQANMARAPAEGRDFASMKIHKSKLGDIHVFRMPMFHTPEIEQGERIVRMVEESLPKADAIILDLRGNGGGYAFIPLRIAALLWGVPYRDVSLIQNYPQPVQEIGRLGGPYVHALTKNAAIASGTPFGRYVVRQTRLDPWDRLLNWYHWEDDAPFRAKWGDLVGDPFPSEIETNTAESKVVDVRKLGFAKPIFLIVNGACASACEILLESLEEHPFASTWGERTMGAVQFGSVIEMALPHSQLTVSMPTSYVLYKDGRKPDSTGYAPKHILDRYKTDPVSHIEALIEMGRYQVPFRTSVRQ